MPNIEDVNSGCNSLLQRMESEESVSEHSNSDSPHAAALSKVKVSKILVEDF